MKKRDRNERKALKAQLAAGALLAVVFVSLGVWGVSAGYDQPFKWLFLSALTIFSALYIFAVVLIIRQRVGLETADLPTAEACWFDRTMNLNDLPSADRVNVEYEITYIHSDFVVK